MVMRTYRTKTMRSGKNVVTTIIQRTNTKPPKITDGNDNKPMYGMRECEGSMLVYVAWLEWKGDQNSSMAF